MRLTLPFFKSTFLTFALISFGKLAFSQGDAIDLIQAREDATKLTQAYLNPFFKGLGSGMNNGWFNSAKTKNLGRFDLRIQASGAFVPSSDQTFDVNKLGLTRFQAAPGSSSLSPTVFGKDEDGVTLVDKNNPSINFELPSGTGIHIAPSPQIQLTAGLVYDTEISLRFTPKVGSNDFGKVGSWGIGVKKEITKLLPWKTEKVIPIDLAIALGYNQINYDHKVAIEDQIGDDNVNNLDQRIKGKFSGFTGDLIVSKKLAVFTPFASIGYNSAKTDIGILGTYKFNGEADLVDPVKIKQTDISGMRGAVGFGLHLAFFRLYGAYNIGEYQSVTAGIGFGIGK
ncbi:DUF6588 family protein [Pseudopedobacter sp.]|uniref:DUF6588 family protein n=1 Tax=Pseudopedobacter sp. TaxID=1936787 RepID=UPI00333E33B4